MKSPTKSRLQGVFVVACVVGVVLLFLRLAHVSSRGGETIPVYSVRRFDPHGTAAFYRLLARRVKGVRCLERPRLGKDDEGVLIQVLGLEEADPHSLLNPHAEVYTLPTEELLEWVSRGNTLVQLTRERTEVMEELKVPDGADQVWAGYDPWDFGPNPGPTVLKLDTDTFASIERHERKGGLPDETPGYLVEVDWAWPGVDGGVGAEGRGLFRSPRVFGKAGPRGWRPIAWAGRITGGEPVPVAGVIPHGLGRVVVVGAPTAALNGSVTDEDNLGFLLELVGDGPVIFDEWAHGIGHSGTVLEVMSQFGLIPFLFQFAVIVLIYRWSTAGFYRPDGSPPQRARSSSEQIDTLARLYVQALSDEEKLRAVYDEVGRRFTRACRCSVESVRESLDKLGTPAARRALELLNSVAGLAGARRPRCPGCGYDLGRLKTDHCPECGKLIPLRVRRLMNRPELAPDTEAADKRWNPRDLARVLTIAHDLTQELQRGRKRPSRERSDRTAIGADARVGQPVGGEAGPAEG